MTKDIWVISDTHLNHRNILNFIDEEGNRVRPFGSVNEMNEKIIDRWNSVVKPGDKVYHLGDVAFGSKKEFPDLWAKFNGKKRLIVGNHDDIKFMTPYFDKVMMWRVWMDHGLLFSHVPVHQSAFTNNRIGLFNVHGHIHSNPTPDGPYFNVSVEAVNYTPIHIETLAQIAREWKDADSI